MGGDQVVRTLTSELTEHELGDEIRAAEKTNYQALINEVETMEGSRELIEELKRRGHAVVLASSAKSDEVEHYLDLLGARKLTDDWTTSADVEATNVEANKPEADLVRAALERAGAEPSDAVMVGDTPWDVEAARNANVPTIAVRTGGFGADELREAGAVALFESVSELLSRLDQTALA